ncbi:MAG: hypothetical protein PHX08_09990 [Lachnospiraceae bacterium]|nr:hypothetical protein [Lachnospiraceae bacterium]
MQSSDENQLKLIKLITEVIDLTTILERKYDFSYLNSISAEIDTIGSHLKELSKDIKQYASKKELKETKNRLESLNKELTECLSEENEAAQEIFCSLIKENLPDNIDSTFITSNKVAMMEKDTKKPQLLGTIEVTGSNVITVDVKFEYDSKINKCFKLDNFKRIYSVIDYINLGMGYSKSIH